MDLEGIGIVLLGSFYDLRQMGCACANQRSGHFSSCLAAPSAKIYFENIKKKKPQNQVSNRNFRCLSLPASADTVIHTVPLEIGTERSAPVKGEDLLLRRLCSSPFVTF